MPASADSLLDSSPSDAPGSEQSAPIEGAAGSLSTSGEPITQFHGLTLSHFQIEAIEAIRAGQNVLVSAPTGAGKTLVAEYAIEDAVRRKKRCIYTAPIKALSNQKYRDFRDNPDIDVGLMTGDVTLHPTAQVLVMTTEILRNAIFENPRQLADIEYVVFDEVHYMDDLERGSVWEESLIFAPASIRFIALSATIANLEQLGAWIREIRTHELKVVHSNKRPVPLKHRLYAAGAGLFDLSRLDHLRRRIATEGSLAEGAPPAEPRRGKPKRQQQHRERKERGSETATVVLDQLQRQGLLPALVFSFSRKDCERLALANQHRNLLSAEEHERMQLLQSELVRLFQLDAGELLGQVFQLAAHGLGYHHAGMLPIHKEVVERMFTSGLLKLLFTTETFALGINMPARTVVFHALKKFDGVSFDWLRARDYMQMAGRAGRQGKDKEGLVVSLVGEREILEAPLEHILSGKPEAVQSRFALQYSSILHLLEWLGRERLHEAWEKSFNQYQHRAGSKAARERNRAEQASLLEAHLTFLEQLGYIEGGNKLTARGKIARSLYGYELQITEMLFRGGLEDLPTDALAMVFTALIYEERRRFDLPHVPSKMYGGVRRHLTQMIGRLQHEEQQAGVPTPMKMPDWGLTPVVLRWMLGGKFQDLEQFTDTPLGDICRTFRMAIQLMRQVRRAIDPSWDLAERLNDAVEAMNRDEVDARRQLELG